MKVIKTIGFIIFMAMFAGVGSTICLGNTGCNSGTSPICDEICPGGVGAPCTYMDCGSGTELCEYDDHLPIII